MGLSELNTHIECDELVFWGKITGLKNDYFIAMGLVYREMYEFPTKSFFWALSSDFSFKPMPSLNSQHDEKINSDASFFTGEPGRMIFQVKPAENGEEAEPKGDEEEQDEAKKQAVAQNSDESEEEEIKVPPRDLTGKLTFSKIFAELDRLTSVVYAIENDCQMCPVGAFKMTPDHQVRRNEAFRGLQGSDALDLSNYMHFRNVQDG